MNKKIQNILIGLTLSAVLIFSIGMPEISKLSFVNDDIRSLRVPTQFEDLIHKLIPDDSYQKQTFLEFLNGSQKSELLSEIQVYIEDGFDKTSFQVCKDIFTYNDEVQDQGDVVFFYEKSSDYFPFRIESNDVSFCTEKLRGLLDLINTSIQKFGDKDKFLNLTNLGFSSVYTDYLGGENEAPFVLNEESAHITDLVANSCLVAANLVEFNYDNYGIGKSNVSISEKDTFLSELDSLSSPIDFENIVDSYEQIRNDYSDIKICNTFFENFNESYNDIYLSNFLDTFSIIRNSLLELNSHYTLGAPEDSNCDTSNEDQLNNQLNSLRSENLKLISEIEDLKNINQNNEDALNSQVLEKTKLKQESEFYKKKSDNLENRHKSQVSLYRRIINYLLRR